MGGRSRPAAAAGWLSGLRVLVDTSAWIDFLNGHLSPHHAALTELINDEHDLCTCGVVVAEVFQGLRRESGLAELSALFRAMTFLEASGIDLHLRAADLYRALRRQGKTVRSTIDCLIAVLAEENGCAVLARDRDLELLLGSGLLRAKLLPV
jgi:predicted nucleic acid-binding protein